MRVGALVDSRGTMGGRDEAQDRAPPGPGANLVPGPPPSTSLEDHVRLARTSPRPELGGSDQMTSVRVPGFEPSVNGFHFSNSFSHSPLREFKLGDIATLDVGDAANGLCGGVLGLRLPPGRLAVRGRGVRLVGCRTPTVVAPSPRRSALTGRRGIGWCQDGAFGRRASSRHPGAAGARFSSRPISARTSPAVRSKGPDERRATPLALCPG